MATSGAKDHIIEIIIETKDHTEGGLKKAADRLLAFDRRVQQTQARIRSIADRAHNVTLRLIDRVTPAGSRINRLLHGLAGRAHRVTLNMNDRITSKLRATEAKLFKLTAKAHTITVNLKDKALNGIKGIGNNLISSVAGVSGDMLVGAGISYGIYDTIKTYKDFEAQMSRVGAISGATSEDMLKLKARAKEMGSQTKFSATEAGQAMEYMAMAGWKTEQITSGLPGIMNLAAASGESLANVSDIVTDAMTAFGMGADKAGHFADVLAAASSNANTNVGLMGETFKYAAPLAGAFKYSLEDTATAIGLMANQGIKGSEAGTALRSIFLRLNQPPKEAAAALDKLGFSAARADGTMRPFRECVDELRAKFANLSDAEKGATAKAIAGTYAVSGFLAMMNSSQSDLDKLTDAINNADGAAEKMANTMIDNLGGDLTILGSTWESLQLTLMEGPASDGLRSFIQAVQQDVQKFNEYLQDGFDISDVGKIALDVLTQLKDKFLAFDGVGSVLAGGVLIGALTKITSKTMKLVDLIKTAGNVGGAAGDGSIGGLAGAAGSAASVGAMTVNATSVVINGNPGALGGAGNLPVPPTNGKGGKPSGQPNGGAGNKAGRLSRSAKVMGAVAATATVALGAYDAYNINKANEARAQEAERKESEAHAQFIDTREKYTRGEVGYKEYEQSHLNYQEAQKQQQEVERENTNQTGESVGGTIGALLGGVIGTFVGGPAGTMIGSTLGAEAGKVIGSHATDIRDAMVEATRNEGESELAGSDTESLFDDSDTSADFAEQQSEAFDGLWESIKNGAADTWTAMTDGATTAWEAVSGAFSAAGSWFEENVHQPISNATASAGEAITGAFSGAWNFVVDTWGAAASWFDENVVEPIKSAFGKISSFGESVAGFFRSDSGSEAQHAGGGVFTSPHRGIVAEAGPEAIIPLGRGMRDRAIDLWGMVGQSLGIDTREEAPFAFPSWQGVASGDNEESAAAAPALTASAGEGSGNNIQIDVGGLSLSLEVNAGKDGEVDADAIMEAVRANFTKLADDVAGHLAEKMSSTWENQPVSVA